MKQILPVEELARDARFEKIKIEEVIFDPRGAAQSTKDRQSGFKPTDAEAPDAVRGLMHGIFVGEIQALEGAGRTCWDFDDRHGQRRRRRSS